MIKNIIFDVGMVLVNWDPHAADPLEMSEEAVFVLRYRKIEVAGAARTPV